MLFKVNICCWMVMVLCRIDLDEFGVKNDKFGTTDPKNCAISENFANSEILQTGPRPRCAISVAFCMGQHAFGLLVYSRVRGAFRSFSLNIFTTL
jgi:hypothetical protein